MGATGAHKDPSIKPLDFLRQEIRFSPGYEILEWARASAPESGVGEYYVLARTPEGQVTVYAGTYGTSRGYHNFWWRDCWSERDGISQVQMPVAWLSRLTPLPELDAAKTERLAALHERLQLLRQEIEHYKGSQSEWDYADEDLVRRDTEVKALTSERSDLDPDFEARAYRDTVRRVADMQEKLGVPGTRFTLRGVTRQDGRPLEELKVVRLERGLTVAEDVNGLVRLKPAHLRLAQLAS